MRQLRGTPLKRFIRDWRRAHPLRSDIALVLESVSYPVNVGSLFRIADAGGISQMILCGATPTPPSQTISKVGRERHHDVRWRYEQQAESAIREFREAGYAVCAIELTDDARPYYEMDWPSKLCLVIGNEDHGVTRDALSLCDSAVFVPMYGKGLSLNVHVCTAIVIYHILHH